MNNLTPQMQTIITMTLSFSGSSEYCTDLTA